MQTCGESWQGFVRRPASSRHCPSMLTTLVLLLFLDPSAKRQCDCQVLRDFGYDAASWHTSVLLCILAPWQQTMPIITNTTLTITLISYAPKSICNNECKAICSWHAKLGRSGLLASPGRSPEGCILLSHGQLTNKSLIPVYHTIIHHAV